MKFNARAHSNFALVKYWGKRPGASPDLNLPAVGSVSLTVAALATETTVEFADGLIRDEVELLDETGTPVDNLAAIERVVAHLDRVRAMASETRNARVRSQNDFPMGAGLASSASAFAALTLAAARSAGLNLDRSAASRLARRGSGSAARSLFGGFVEMQCGVQPDGSDASAMRLADPKHWDLNVVIAITDASAKAVGSTQGMIDSEQSAFFGAWVEKHDDDVKAMKQAIQTKDFDRLADITEHSCLKMHATMFTNKPGLIYWNPATLEAIHAVRALRAKGTPVCFTVDAGPQVKAICPAEHADSVANALGALPGVERVIKSTIGYDALVAAA